jgi:hypothetical protein
MGTVDRRSAGDLHAQIGIVVAIRGLLKRNEPATGRMRTPDGQIPFGRREIVRCCVVCVANMTSQRVKNLGSARGRALSLELLDLEVFGRGLAAIGDDLVFDLLAFIECAESGSFDC